jgi:oxygen-independent coproporphyrinogen-3 oxidase
MAVEVASIAPYPKKYTTPFILYPPALWRNNIGHEFTQRHLGLDEVGQDYVMYLSVPYCRVRCFGCPYFIAGLSPKDPHNKEQAYVNAVVTDLERWSTYKRFQTGTLRAVYIGGGTGSLLKTENIKRIVETIIGRFPVAEDYEFTLEGNARDYDADKLDYVADSPITRVSLGVQSFDEALLRTIGSPHAAQQSIDCIDGLSERGFHNIQMDMMYNLPGHTRQVWKSDLEMLKQLDVKHLTTYLYRIHPGTPQDKFIVNGKVAPPVDKDSAYVKSMYRDLVDIVAEIGFENYMFDHFSIPGSENVYNDWTFRQSNVEILGVGPGAYGFINNFRVGAKKDVEEYVATIGRGEHMVSAVSEQLAEQNRKERYLINVLQYFAIDAADYVKAFPGSDLDEDFGPTLERILERGLATRDNGMITLTDLGKEWHMNVMLEFTNPAFWGDTSSLEHPHWAMNTPMVDLFAGQRSDWLGV